MEKKAQNDKRDPVFDSKEQRSLFPTISVTQFLNMSLSLNLLIQVVRVQAV